MQNTTFQRLKLVFEASGTLEWWGKIVSSETKFLLITSHGKFEILLGCLFSLYIGVTLPDVPIVSFYVRRGFLATIWNKLELAMLKFMSNIKDKYDLVRAISNLGFLTILFFSLL